MQSWQKCTMGKSFIGINIGCEGNDKNMPIYNQRGDEILPIIRSTIEFFALYQKSLKVYLEQSAQHQRGANPPTGTARTTRTARHLEQG